MRSTHLVLLGDSIFDNAAYVEGKEAVIDHVRNLILPNEQAKLLARDGAVVRDVSTQFSHVPKDVTHLVISAGGNDALKSLEAMSLPTNSVMGALGHLSEIRNEFRKAYLHMLWQALNFQVPTAVCTIYDRVPGLSEELLTALCIFNDTIVSEANAAGVDVIDLRPVCNEFTDYSEISPIEPSVSGGRKIARAISHWIPCQKVS